MGGKKPIFKPPAKVRNLDSTPTLAAPSQALIDELKAEMLSIRLHPYYSSRILKIVNKHINGHPAAPAAVANNQTEHETNLGNEGL